MRGVEPHGVARLVRDDEAGGDLAHDGAVRHVEADRDALMQEIEAVRRVGPGARRYVVADALAGALRARRPGEECQGQRGGGGDERQYGDDAGQAHGSSRERHERIEPGAAVVLQRANVAVVRSRIAQGHLDVVGGAASACLDRGK